MKITGLKRYYPIILIVVAAACSDRPKEVLDEDEMVNLMVDMQLAEAYTNSHYQSGTDREEIGKRVLQQHGVSQETLDTTLAWYGRNLDEYTGLFEKVDKKIGERRDRLMQVPGMEDSGAGEDLWIYQPHLMISELSGDNGFKFDFPVSQIEKGRKLQLSFYLPNALNLKSTFGVKYSEGGGEVLVSNFTSKNEIEIELQTDTAKSVSGIFGWVNFKDNFKYPVLIDSISIVTLPIDSAKYMANRRSQKKLFL